MIFKIVLHDIVFVLDPTELKEQELSNENEEKDNQFLRRLSLRQVLKDHLILVQLFQMTEDNFGKILLTYYCFLVR